MSDYTDLKALLGEPIISQAHEDRRITSGPLAERLISERMEALAAITALEADIARLQTAHVQMQRAMTDLAAENARLRGAVQKADDHLTNLQPHIPQACYPDRRQFIDSNVDCAQEVLRAALTAPTSGC